MNWLAIFIMPFVLHEKLLRCRRRRLRRGTEFNSLRKLRAVDPITHTRPSIFILHLASSPITDHKQYPPPGPGKHPQRRPRWDESSNLLSQCHAFWINKYFHSTYTMGRQFAAEKNPKQTHWGHVHHRRRSRRVVKRISVFVSRPSWSWINKWIRGVNKELWRPDITLFISAKKIYIHRSTNTMPSCFVYQCGPEQRGSSSFSYQDQQWNSIKLEEHSSLGKENFTAKGIYKGPTFDFFKVHRPQGVINMLIISNSLSYHHPSSPK